MVRIEFMRYFMYTLSNHYYFLDGSWYIRLYVREDPDDGATESNASRITVK